MSLGSPQLAEGRARQGAVNARGQRLTVAEQHELEAGQLSYAREEVGSLRLRHRQVADRLAAHRDRSAPGRHRVHRARPRHDLTVGRAQLDRHHLAPRHQLAHARLDAPPPVSSAARSRASAATSRSAGSLAAAVSS